MSHRPASPNAVPKQQSTKSQSKPREGSPLNSESLPPAEARTKAVPSIPKTTNSLAWIYDNGPLPDPHGHGERAVKFINALRHPKSNLPKKQFQLDPWQERIVRRIYGDTRPNKQRRIKTVMLLIGRGNRKTTLAAAIELLHTVGPERVPQGLAVSIANDRDQARLTLDEMSGMIAAHPRLVEATRVQSTLNRITHDNSGARYQAMSADAATAHGRTPNFAFVDELHEFKKGDLYYAITSGLNKTPGSLLFIATTAGVGQTTIAWDLYDYAKRVAAGTVTDDSFLPILFQAEAESDWRDEQVWRDTNPGLAHGYPDIDGLRKFVREAEHRPAQREVFKRLHLGMWLDGAAEPAFDLAVWDEGNEPFDLVDLEGCKAWIGVDLSKVTDLCAVSAAIQMPAPANDNTYALHVRSFAPSEGIRKRSDVDHVPYVLWSDQGFLAPTPGDTVDLAVVESAIRELCELFDVQEISFDRWSARQMMDNLAEDGLPVVEFPQNLATFAAPVIEFEKALFERRIVHGGNPLLRWAVGNLVFMEDASGNRRRHKAKSIDRIDPAVASIMAVGRAAANASVSSSYVTEDWAGGLVFA
jgi:phage terminase large subunit-like protein